MPVRLAGLLRPTADDRRAGEAFESEWGARYPARPSWERWVHRAAGITVFLDTCGDSSVSRSLAADGHACGVAGTIRLDRGDILRADLGEESSVARSDPALILLAYQRWGPSAFCRLRGDFAFVAWDSQKRAFWLVRDAFGIRRLHYSVRNDTIVFASDVEGVLAWPGISRDPDDVTILDNLLGRYLTRERTFFRHIKRVLPGSFLRVAPSGVDSVCYLEPPRPSSVLGSLADYAEALRAELVRAVAERIPDSGDVVCHASGGLDSASVASLSAAELAREGRGRRVALATARFPGLLCDEGPWVQELGRWLGVPVDEWDGRRPETSDLASSRPAWPFGRSSVGGSYQGDLELAERHGARVLLSGVGGNQIAVEKGFLRDCWGTGHLKGLVGGLIQIARGRPWRWEPRHFRKTLGEAVRAVASAPEGRESRSGAEPPLPRWLGPRLRRVVSQLPLDFALPRKETPTSDSFMADTIWEQAVADPTLVWTLEHEDARATERGLEFRYPYLCWSILTLAMSIPWRLRAPGEMDRSWQRRALIGVLPERLRLRDTFANFNDAILANTQGAAPQIEALLTQGPWASEGFVERKMALQDFRGLATRSPQWLAADRESWRRIRDVAALEAWLRSV